jgi:hypothetical protein
MSNVSGAKNLRVSNRFQWTRASEPKTVECLLRSVQPLPNERGVDSIGRSDFRLAPKPRLPERVASNGGRECRSNVIDTN